VIDAEGEPNFFVSSLKRSKVAKPLLFNTTNFLLATEYIFDYFLMAYINGLRSFGHKSMLTAAQSKSKKRKSTEKWMDALAKAEHAHLLCREAAALAHRGMVKEAEESAAAGISELKERLV
jgi:hypothetical protein